MENMLERQLFKKIQKVNAISPQRSTGQLDLHIDSSDQVSLHLEWSVPHMWCYEHLAAALST